MSQFALFVAAGSAGATHSSTSSEFTDFVGGQPLWLSFKYKGTRVTAGANVAKIRATLYWYDSVGSNFATTFVEDVIVDATVDWTFKELKHTAPIGAVKGVAKVQITPTTDPIAHDVWVKQLRLGKTQLFSTAGADIGENLRDSGNILAAWQLRNSRDLGDIAYVTNPDGGWMKLNGTLSGALRIALPMVGSTNTMIRMRVEVFNYETGQSSTYVISGYNATSGWTNVSAQVLGDRSRSLPIRFGEMADGHRAIWVGDPTTVWKYPAARIAEVQVSHSSPVLIAWESGWALTLDAAAATNVGVTVAQPTAGPAFTGNNMFATDGGVLQDSGSYGVRNGNVSINQQGQLLGGGGGQVTIGGLGYGGDMDATNGADLGVNMREGGNILAAWQLRNGRTENNVTTIRHPSGASAYAGSGGLACALRICLPAALYRNNFMFRMRVELYNYTTGQAASYIIGGRMYTDGIWRNPSASFVGDKSMSRQVRFGEINNKPTVFIGDQSTDWPYCQAVVSDVQIAYAGYDLATWENGWFMTFDASTGNITQTISQPTAGPSFTGNNMFAGDGGVLQDSGAYGVRNNQVSINAAGQMLGGGGGQATLEGMGSGPWARETRQPWTVYTGIPNLLFNGSLRLIDGSNKPLGWTVGSGWNWVSGAGEGAYMSNGAGGTSVCESDPITVSAGSNYSLQGELFAGGITAGSLQMDVRWFSDAAGTVLVLDDASLTATNGTGWTKVFRSGYTAPAGAVSARVRVFLSGATNTNADFRRVKFQLGSEQSPFTDEATNSVARLTRKGTNVRVGDQRNLPAIASANLRYKFTGAISYSATSTGATISVTAGSILLGSTSLSLNAMSTTVSGTGGTQTQYDLYITNGSFAGGSFTLVATTDGNAIYSSDDRMWIGTVTVVFPTSGTGGGGGFGGGGAGENCVHVDSWVLTQDGLKRARDVATGDWILALTESLNDTRWVEVTDSYTATEPCYRLTAESGIELVCSQTTPLTLRDGSYVYPPEVTMVELPVRVGNDWAWEDCRVAYAGEDQVQRIYCGGAVYAAGVEQDRMIFTHNPIK